LKRTRTRFDPGRNRTGSTTVNTLCCIRGTEFNYTNLENSSYTVFL
jgi:hypothetical protein